MFISKSSHLLKRYTLRTFSVLSPGDKKFKILGVQQIAIGALNKQVTNTIFCLSLNIILTLICIYQSFIGFDSLLG